jgi:MFS family permease
MGYTLAALFNNAVHIRYGQRGIAIIASVCHLVSYTVIANHPPWPAMVVMFVFIGFGNGLIDAAWGAWISNMTSANQVSGFLNASYSLGAMVAPIVVTLMTSKGLQWHSYYYVMVRIRFPSLLLFLEECQTIYVFHIDIDGSDRARC